MQPKERRRTSVVLRRSLAVLEFAAVCGLLLFGADLWMAERVGGDGIATGFAWLLGALVVLVSPGVAFAAVTAWLGGRRWWVWQAAMLAWAVVLPAGTLLVLMIFGPLFGGCYQR